MSKVKNFLESYDNIGTRGNISNTIKLFFQSIYKEATAKNLDEMAEKYFSQKRDYKKDVRTFLQSLNGSAPLTIRLKISILKTFLIENEIELSLKFWRMTNRKIKGSRALTLDRIPTKTEFKKILMHMPIQGKAFYLILESSGMRIGELLKTNIEDLHLSENPARIQIRGENTKTGNSRHAFFSSEAKEALTEWLKVRKKYLIAASAKSHLYIKSVEDKRVFPFNSTTARCLWKNALHKAGLNGRDKSTNREVLHPHVLRKFFRTKLGAVIPVDIVEALMGHEGYLTEVYRKYTVEDLAKFYLKGEPSLSIFTDTQMFVDLHKQIEEKNTQLQVLVNSLASENQNMKNKIGDQESAIEKLNKKVEEQNQLGEQIVKVGEGVKKWQVEKGEIESKIAGIMNFQRLVLEQPDEAILEFIKDVRRQLKESIEAQFPEKFDDD